MLLNSHDLNYLDYPVLGAMLERYKVFYEKSTKRAEFKTVLGAIWEDLPQEVIDLPEENTGMHSSMWMSL